MDKNPEEPQCVCANNYLEGKGTESVLFSILFSPEDRRDERMNAELNYKRGTGCSEKYERDASKL